MADPARYRIVNARRQPHEFEHVVRDADKKVTARHTVSLGSVDDRGIVGVKAQPDVVVDGDLWRAIAGGDGAVGGADIPDRSRTSPPGQRIVRGLVKAHDIYVYPMG